MKILITGTAGFIGFHLASILLKDGHRVHGYDGLTTYYDVTLKKNRHNILLKNKNFSSTEGMLEDFSKLDNWEEIPTPYFDSVLTYQDYEEDVIRWMYILGGRLCFELDEMDKWQVIPFLNH